VRSWAEEMLTPDRQLRLRFDGTGALSIARLRCPVRDVADAKVAVEIELRPAQVRSLLALVAQRETVPASSIDGA
jgi:hypothetical protein